MALRVQQDSPLLNLPPEIRNSILEMVMYNPCMVEYCFEPRSCFKSGDAHESRCSYKRPAGRSEISILSTCYQFWIEGSAIFYSGTKFTLHTFHGGIRSDEYLSSLLRRHSTQGCRPFSKLRALTLRFHVHPGYDFRTCKEKGIYCRPGNLAYIFAQHCHRLNSIEITFPNNDKADYFICDLRVGLYALAPLRADKITFGGLGNIENIALLSVMQSDLPRIDLVCSILNIVELALKVEKHTKAQESGSKVRRSSINAVVEAMLNWQLREFESLGKILGMQLVSQIHLAESQVDTCRPDNESQILLDQVQCWLKTHKHTFETFWAQAACKLRVQDQPRLCIVQQPKDDEYDRLSSHYDNISEHYSDQSLVDRDLLNVFLQLVAARQSSLSSHCTLCDGRCAVVSTDSAIYPAHM